LKKWSVYNETGKIDWKKVKDVREQLIQDLEQERREEGACFFPQFKDFDCPYGKLCDDVFDFLETLNGDQSVKDAWRKFYTIYCPKKDAIDKTQTHKCYHCDKMLYPWDLKFAVDDKIFCDEHRI